MENFLGKPLPFTVKSSWKANHPAFFEGSERDAARYTTGQMTFKNG